MVSNLIKGIACICGGFLIHFSLGTIYTFGNMSPYVVSYLRQRTSNTWVTPGHMVWVFSLAVFSQAFTMSLGGVIEKKIGSRLTCLIGCWTMSCSTILTYFSIQQNLWSVIATYGFFFGLGTGLTYSVALAAPMKWFPTRKGLVAGTVVAGYGLGSLLFNIVQTRFINPLNISPMALNVTSTSRNATTFDNKYFSDKDVLDKVPTCFLIIGSTYAIIQLLGVILLMNIASKTSSGEVRLAVMSVEDGVNVEETLVGDEKVEEEHHENNKAYNGTIYNNEEKVIDEEYSPKETIKMKKFWILWGTFFLNGIVIVTISSLYKAFGQTFIKDDRYFSIVGAVAAIFNSGGRLIWGRLLDRFSYRIMMSSLTVTMTIIMSTFYLCSIVTSVDGAKAMYFIWVCLLFFCLAGSFAMFPTATAQTFGNKNMAIIYGMVFAGYAVSSILGALISSILLKTIHYGGQFTLATLAALLSLLLTQFFGPLTNKPIDKENEISLK